MKYKKGDDIYLKGQIVGVSSCSEVPFPYEVLIADGFISAREEEIVSVNEPEKPILSKEEAEWLEGLIKFEKPRGQSIYNTLYYITRQGYGYLFEYIDYDKGKKITLNNRIYPGELYPDDLKERFVKAVLYGYEVEKEKLYTVRLKATGEFIYFKKLFQCYNSGTSVKPVAHDNKEYHHAENVLKELLFWDNPAFEIKEVKKEEE